MHFHHIPQSYIAGGPAPLFIAAKKVKISNSCAAVESFRDRCCEIRGEDRASHENIAKLERQLIEFEWLLDKTVAPLLQYLLCLPIYAVATAQQHRDGGF